MEVSYATMIAIGTLVQRLDGMRADISGAGGSGQRIGRVEADCGRAEGGTERAGPPRSILPPVICSMRSAVSPMSHAMERPMMRIATVS